ncbi:4Fe-4S dicluster domain-containing protein [Opitutus terrae]|uniref:4Fe-4S ferredoxin iron-sulfur binding domain protein n=1 Tax=Opitutus terrae (strain DSM 11246 / JCM 15787 / PB90-1) TaxID=452637 RepID=B1ZVT7_OPITP|nr:4Fe-4S dicluster domain-containing protein [Opitutus terrae]ACB75023.1 4Fe-4S ferredoxin iron-sulfur binding domain protein [Opitutus terrae PB90-1]
MLASRDNFPLLTELLAEQQRLATPVARFAAASGGAPALEPVYRDLIPLSAPAAGEQYAFEVDLDACTGCKACVAACHALNGLDEHESWRDVGLLVAGTERRPFQQTITTACHHCADPACLNGCPVLAYEKDPLTGIVRHLDDQCIGCQYCILKCPYDAPKYNARLGIVRKCDMCHDRLAHGEAPACVQACPTHAIRIVAAPTPPRPPEPNFTYYVKIAERRPTAEVAASAELLPGAPSANYTRPMTRYTSQRGLPAGIRAADAMALRPQPAHWPLVIMLTLLPLAIGCQAVVTLVAMRANFTYYVKIGWNVVPGEWAERGAYDLTLCGAVAGVLGLAASVAHLGQPRRAWRIFLGWRRSWLSREAMVFGAWLPLTLATLIWPALTLPAAVVGAVGLGCSVMIYADTRRGFWAAAQTAPRFFGGAAAMGASVAIALGIEAAGAAVVLAAAMLIKLACDARVVRVLDVADEEDPSVGWLATARLLTGPLRRAFGGRLVIALVGGLLLPAWILSADVPPWSRWLWCAGMFAGELVERWLFFRAVDAPKMPGLVG